MTLPPAPSQPPVPPADIASANARALDALAADAGIAVPALLRALVASGATFYGPDWPQQWRTLCLTRPPAFISCEDFEWMNADERRDAVDEWLRPDAQAGRRFLPFAQNGAGDAYCLTLDGDAAPSAQATVALVLHDSGEAKVFSASFDDFACAQLLQAMADPSHSWGDELPETEAIAVARLDVARATALMPPGTARWLQALAAQAPCRATVPDSPGAPLREVLALVTPEQHAQALQRLAPLPPGMPLRFAVVPRWEVRPATAAAVAQPAAAPTWQALAADPATRRQAIRAYQAEHGVDLPTAKAAVDAQAAAQGCADRSS